jgi:hypothetical protein
VASGGLIGHRDGLLSSGRARRYARGVRAAARGAAGDTTRSPAIVHGVQLAFAHSTQTVFYVMAVTFLVSIRHHPRGRAQEAPATDTETLTVVAERVA